MLDERSECLRRRLQRKGENRMVNSRFWIVGWCVLAAAPAALAGDPSGNVDKTGAQDARAMAAKIDKRIADAWEKDHVTPAAPADDAEFLRRVYLDLAGRIPSVSEARAFLKDSSADKRERLVDKLLDGPLYVRHFGNYWKQLLVPEEITNAQFRLLLPGFETWIRRELARNVGYDKLARDLLTAPLGGAGPPQQLLANTGEPSALAYYVAKDVAPENLAASSARVFLGVRVECAQCHNHPFAEWKREQFWGYAAFFAGVQKRNLGNQPIPAPEKTDLHEIKMAGTDKVIQAAFLNGAKPEWQGQRSGRATLADWMTGPDNPYFARAGVNRMWYYFFGTGVIDPVDEMVGGESENSHPELLDELAKDFAAHHFDLKYLIRVITATKAYQLSSSRADKSQDESHLFARKALRGMTAEQLFDSIAEAVGYRDDGPVGPGPFGPANSPRGQFISKFTNQGEKPVEAQTSILQALSLMNGRLVADGTSFDARRSTLLDGLVNFPEGTTASRIETLYLATLSRKPTAKEADRMRTYIESGGAAKTDQPTAEQKNAALADVLWVLLNSGEFIVNH
jgi:hypothetical protein